MYLEIRCLWREVDVIVCDVMQMLEIVKLRVLTVMRYFGAGRNVEM